MCFLYLGFLAIIGLPFSESRDDAVFSSASDNFDLGKSKWMECIPDGTKFFDISIPGTHDSGSYDFTIVPTVRTQAMKWSVQFKMGIRAFDIRILYSTSDDLFTLHHGFKQVNTMKKFLKKAIEFLDANPSEAFIFRMREEFKDLRARFSKDQQGHNDKVKARMRKYIADNSDYFYKPPDSQFTMGDVRRKMVILYDNLDFGEFGLSYRSTCKIQDDWVVSPKTMHEKWIKIKNQMQTSLGGESGQCFMNYVSGAVKMLPLGVANGDVLGIKPWKIDYYPSTAYPEFPNSRCRINKQCVYLEGMNIMTRNYLRDFITTLDGESGRAYGIFYADFAGNSFVDVILKSNARLPGVNANPADLNNPSVNFAQMCHKTTPVNT